jgi:hypothetical protein
MVGAGKGSATACGGNITVAAGPRREDWVGMADKSKAPGGRDRSSANYHQSFMAYIDPGGGKQHVAQARGVTFDAAGNVYVAGGTTDFATTKPDRSYGNTDHGVRGAFRPKQVFIAKYGPDGRRHWLTEIGGGGYDRAYAVATNGKDVVVAGRAGPGFHTTSGVYQSAFGGDVPDQRAAYGPQDGFVSKLNPADGSLRWSTYVGGVSGSFLRDATIDREGRVYLAHAHIENARGEPMGGRLNGPNGVSQLSADGKTMLWSRWIGNAGSAHPGQPSVHVNESATMVTFACYGNSSAPTTPGAYQENYQGNGKPNLYIAKFDVSGDTPRMIAATFFGGAGAWAFETHNMTVDRAGHVIIASAADPTNPLEVTPDAYQRSPAPGKYAAYIIRLSPDLKRLDYATWFSGARAGKITSFEGVGIGPEGQVVIGGASSQPDLPTTDGSRYRGGNQCAIVTVWSPDLTQLEFCSYVTGGRGRGGGRAAAIAPDGSIACAGAEGEGHRQSKAFVAMWRRTGS